MKQQRCLDARKRRARLFQVVPGLCCALIRRDFWELELTVPGRRRLLFPSVIAGRSAAGGRSCCRRRRRRRLRNGPGVQKQEVLHGRQRPLSDWPNQHFQGSGVLGSDAGAQLLHFSDVCSQLLQEGEKGGGTRFLGGRHQSSVKKRRRNEWT